MSIDWLRNSSGWGPGPWREEPDRVDFESRGFHCLLLRHLEPTYLGYVAVPPGHPWHGKLSGRTEADPHLDGALFYYAGHSHSGIYVPSVPNALDDFWWLGFEVPDTSRLCTGPFHDGHSHGDLIHVALTPSEYDDSGCQGSEDRHALQPGEHTLQPGEHTLEPGMWRVLGERPVSPTWPTLRLRAWCEVYRNVAYMRAMCEEVTRLASWATVESASQCVFRCKR